MNFAKWLGFGQRRKQTRTQQPARRALKAAIERLEDRSLLTTTSVLVAANTSCGAPNYASVDQAVNSTTGFTVVNICGGTYGAAGTNDGSVDTNLDGTDPDILSPGAISGQTAQVVINGSFTLKGSSVPDSLSFDVNSDTDYDQFVVNGRPSTDPNGAAGITLNDANLMLNGNPTSTGLPIVLIKNNSQLAVDGVFERSGNAVELLEGDSIVFDNGAVYTITYKFLASDSDGVANDIALIPVTAIPNTPGTAVAITDPLALTSTTVNTDPHNQAIFVTGTTANNTLDVHRKDATHIEVKIDGKSALIVDTTAVLPSDGLPIHITHIVVYGGAGDDKITVDSALTIPDILFGEDGKDQLQAGSGPSVLVGGAGDDTLRGNKANDILIGGLGKDNLGGGDGSDILIGGTTLEDNDLRGLAFLLTLSFQDAVSQLNGIVFNETDANGNLAPVTDTMDGNAGADLYFADLAGTGKDSIKLAPDDYQPVPID